MREQTDLIDTSREYLVKPWECFSTHGAAGWPAGSFKREDSKLVCGLCGMICEPIPNVQIPSWVEKGISFEDDQQQKREKYLRSRNLVERLMDFLFRRDQ